MTEKTNRILKVRMSVFVHPRDHEYLVSLAEKMQVTKSEALRLLLRAGRRELKNRPKSEHIV